MVFMIRCSCASTSSAVHTSRSLFCAISSALVATPPAFTALLGATIIPGCSIKNRSASLVVGMFATSM